MNGTYLFLGPELGQKQEELKKLKALINDPDMEVSRYHAFETDDCGFLSDLLNVSLFGSYRLVIISEADELKADALAGILEYTKNPGENSALVLSSKETRLAGERGSKSEKVIRLLNEIEKSVPPDRKTVCYEMFENQKPTWLSTFFSSRGFTIESDARDLMLDMVENNQMELAAAANRLMSFKNQENGQNTITAEDVESYISHTRAESPATLFSHILEKDFPASLASLNAILLSGDIPPSQIISALSAKMRRFASFVELIDDGRSEVEAFAEADSGYGYKNPVRLPKEKDDLRKGARKFRSTDAARMCALLSSYDLRLRETPLELQQIIWEELLYCLIIKNGVPSHSSDQSFGNP